MNQVQKFTTNNGRHIYTFPVQAFPGLRTNIYIINDGDSLILVDTGSGMERSNEELLAGITAVSEQYNESISLPNLTHILITHGHIDHFGGLPFAANPNPSPILAKSCSAMSKAITFCWPWKKQVPTPNTSTSAAN